MIELVQRRQRLFASRGLKAPGPLNLHVGMMLRPGAAGACAQAGSTCGLSVSGGGTTLAEIGLVLHAAGPGLDRPGSLPVSHSPSPGPPAAQRRRCSGGGHPDRRLGWSERHTGTTVL